MEPPSGYKGKVIRHRSVDDKEERRFLPSDSSDYGEKFS